MIEFFGELTNQLLITAIFVFAVGAGLGMLSVRFWLDGYVNERPRR